jgi:DNA-binding response OmpR family regulator
MMMKTAKILCIEDEADLRSDIAEELEDAGYRVLQAGNGHEGLREILRSRPDLVVSDITMPGLDGYGLLKELREKHAEFAEMPFIFLSALADRKDEIQGVKLGADDYLTKPVDFEIMLTRVEASLRQAMRVNQKKQQEHIKLYKALTQDSGAAQKSARQAEPQSSGLPSLRINLVGASQKDLWGLQRILEDDGHMVTVFTSGRSYLDNQEKFPAHLSFICLHTDDMQAPMIARMTQEPQGVLVLAVPGEFDDVAHQAALRSFGAVLTFPAEPARLFEQIRGWLSQKSAA